MSWPRPKPLRSASWSTWNGLSNRDAAAVLGISHQRVSQLSRRADQAAG
jgi:hypothetical protein